MRLEEEVSGLRKIIQSLVKYNALGAIPSDPRLSRSGWGAEICLSNKLPGGTVWKPLSRQGQGFLQSFSAPGRGRGGGNGEEESSKLLHFKHEHYSRWEETGNQGIETVVNKYHSLSKHFFPGP